jgi:peptidoglycan/LPS O-acetylase OafA/YrhL
MTNDVIHGEGLGKPATLNLSGRIPELDGLRGVAIGMVLLCHFFFIFIQARPGSPGAYLLTVGRLTWSGVDLFFVLSGFLIGGILLDARGSSNYFQVFYTRRFFRIVPIYAVLLLASYFFTLLWQAHMLGGSNEIFGDRLPWLPFALFLQNFELALRNSWGIFPLGVTWSLAVEEQFYLTLPLLIRFLDRRALLAVVFSGIALAPVLRTVFLSLSPPRFLAWYTLMPCRADALLFGVLGAMALREPRWRDFLLSHRRLLTRTLFVLLLGAAFLAWRAPGVHDPLMVTIGFTWLALLYLAVLLDALLFPAGWMARCLRWGWLGGLGAIAYGTYLFHQLFLGLFFGRLPWISSFHQFALAVFTLAFTLVFCRLSWLYFEKPLVRRGHRARYTFADSAPAESAPTAPELARP